MKISARISYCIGISAWFEVIVHIWVSTNLGPTKSWPAGWLTDVRPNEREPFQSKN